MHGGVIGAVPVFWHCLLLPHRTCALEQVQPTAKKARAAAMCAVYLTLPSPTFLALFLFSWRTVCTQERRTALHSASIRVHTYSPPTSKCLDTSGQGTTPTAASAQAPSATRVTPAPLASGASDVRSVHTYPRCLSRNLPRKSVLLQWAFSLSISAMQQPQPKHTHTHT